MSDWNTPDGDHGIVKSWGATDVPENGATVEVVASSISDGMTTPRIRDPKKSRRKNERAVRSELRFRKACSRVLVEANKCRDFLLDDGRVADEGLEHIVRAEEHLDDLYECGWGGDMLKRVVVELQSHLQGVPWHESHIELLRDFIPRLRVRHVIDESTIDSVFESIDRMGLDPLVGTFVPPGVRDE